MWVGYECVQWVEPREAKRGKVLNTHSKSLTALRVSDITSIT